jgi:hypothetical protein
MSEIDTYVAALKVALAMSPLANRQIAEASNGAFSTRWLTGFRSGAMQNPQIATLRALEQILKAAVSDEANAA